MTAHRKENILYELFVYAEWRPDPDFIRGEIARERSTTFFEVIVSALKSETLLENVSSFVNQQQPWQICLGDDGKVVAVLQDSVLEIRTKRGNFSTIVARAGVPRDPHPQWRKMVWSPDCSMLAISQSNGNVSFYDLMATTLFTIQSDHIQQAELLFTDNSYAISGIVFLTCRVDRKGIKQKWSSEVLLVDYKGCLRSYFVSPTDGFTVNHTFNFEGGVSTVTYHSSHNLLFVTGLPSDQKDINKASYHGLKCWRLLNDSPFYKLNSSFEHDVPITFTYLLKSALFPNRIKRNESIITRAVASPNGTLLACLHLNGTVSLWNLPNLKISKICPLTSQPGFELKSPLTVVGKHKVWPVLTNEHAEYIPIDLSWWTDEALIISRLNGSISICSTTDLSNLLGDSPEFLQGHPQISSTFDNGFLSLECEAMLVSAKKIRRDSESSELTTSSSDKKDDLGESCDDEKVSFISRSTEIIKTALYIVTDLERFQPKPKKLRLLSRVYRLLCLRSTTPEDLFVRKIENADFSEALNLSQTYSLDSDLVYQQQWRTSPVSHQSIKDYLSKVSKKIWGIQQCCDRVPEALTAAKELLEFGLEISSAEMLKNIKEKNKSVNTLKTLKVSDLSGQQSEILRYRHTMLFYLDRLEIYKAIIKCENSSYSSKEYDNLRVNTITQSAIDLARNGRIQALGCLWPHLKCLSQQLSVLKNLPETLDPNEYKMLLPNNLKKHVPHEPKALKREVDWCENEIFKDIWDSNVWNDDLDSPDGDSAPTPTNANLSEWYSSRAKEIELLSGLPGNALKLITIGREGNVPGLNAIENLFITLNTLVYDVNVDDMTFECLEGCSSFQIIKFLMSKSTELSVINDIKKILFPYLVRCQNLSDTPNLKNILFKEYLINIAKEDLTLPIVILRSNELFLNTRTCLDLVEGCLLVQDSLDQLDLCFQLLSTLEKERDDSVAPSYYVKAFDEMERILEACALLRDHNVSIMYTDLKNMSNNTKDAIDILKKVANNTSHSASFVSTESWNKLLTDILQLQKKVFCCVDIEICYEIYALSLLMSSNKISIQSAKYVLTSQPNKDPSPPMEAFPLEKAMSSHKILVSQKVPYNRSVSLVLEAAVKYFNSASSISSPSLDYAWICLQLLKHEIPDIEKEKDLLMALKIIEEFDLSILPIQVRLYTPKLGLIEDCLNCNNKVYKSVDKLIYLAKLLGISSDNDKQREIIIISLCAEKAADNEDFDVCQSLCRRLLSVTSEIPPGSDKAERAARRLGSETRLTDANLRKELLNLALLFCEAQHIEQLIQIRSFVEAEMLKNDMNYLINLTSKLSLKQANINDSIESTDEDYVDALTSPLVENKNIISATHVLEKYIQKPLQSLSDKSTAWKEVLNIGWLNEKRSAESKDVKFALKDAKICCPYFYTSLCKNCYISNIFTQYDKFTTPDLVDKQLMLLQALMRSNFLQDTVSYGSSDINLNDALMQCSELVLCEDTALFLSQLLSISNPQVFDKILYSSFLDSKTITPVIYFYTLLNYSEMNNLLDEAFFLPPDALMQNVFKAIDKNTSSRLSEALINCRKRYIEILEGEKLNLMGCNVDITQFIDNEVYRKNVIISLASTSKMKNYETAKELALKYSIDEIEIAITYVSYILKNYLEIGYNECIKLASQSAIIEVLKRNPTLVINRLTMDVWNNLEGSDIQHLMLFLSVSTKIDDNHVFDILSVKEHMKLIKKVKSACADINYKFLLKSPNTDELVEHVLPFLTNENVGLITKLFRNIPQSLNIAFDSSDLYYQWIIKHFFDVPINMQSPKKWMQQYRQCSSLFNKLKMEDLQSLIEYLLFSSKSTDILSPHIRIQIAYQTAELCTEWNDDNAQIEMIKSWNQISEVFFKWGRFLENLNSENIQNIFKHLNVSQEIQRCFENSQGEINDLLQCLQTLIKYYEISFKECNVIIDMLSDKLLNINDVLMDVMKQENIEKNMITNVVNIILGAKTNNVDLSPEIFAKLKPYSSSSLLSSKEKLEIMRLFKTNSQNQDGEMLIEMTKELIHNTWNQKEFLMDEENIQNEEKRNNIFIQLIDVSDTWNKLHVLVDLVTMWKPKSTFEIKFANPYILLIKKILNDVKTIEDNIPLLKLLIEKNGISEDEISKIISEDSSCHIVGKIWLCLLGNHENILKSVIPSLISQENNLHKYDEYFDDHLISLIVNKRLLIPLVDTVLYPKCVQYLLRVSDAGSHGDGEYTTSMAIQDLLRNNYIAEAGALKLAAMGIPHTLRNFTQALKLTKHFKQ